MSELQEATKEFLIESHENLDQLDTDLVGLENASAPAAALGRIFRTLHTIKGSCSFLGFSRLEALAHAGENLLGKLRDGEVVPSLPVTEALLRTVDAMRHMLSSIESVGTDGDSDQKELIDSLNQLTRTDSAMTTAAQAPPAVSSPDLLHFSAAGKRSDDSQPPAADSEVPAESSAVADASVRIHVDLLDKLMAIAGEIVLARNQIVQYGQRSLDPSFQNTCRQFNLITTELQEHVMKTRLQPLANVWNRFPRLVRDAALSCGKQVRLETEGSETELDKTLIEAIRDPLTHLVRNAIDHGIEARDVRRAMGKPDEGCVRLRAYHEGGQVNIEISDDGGGIDPERIKHRAIEQHLVTAEQADRMGAQTLLGLIFLPGFSTAPAVTTLSGRGVGMDVVKTNIEKIGGLVDVQSNLGEGTTVRIRIPLTLAIIKVLVVTSAGDRYAIPQVSIIEVVHVDGDKIRKCIRRVHDVLVYRHRDRLLPLVNLNELLRVEPCGDDDDGGMTVVVLQAADRRFGLMVDRIDDTQEIVVKPLWKPLKSLACFAGATVMGDGRVALILDVFGLAQRAGALSDLQSWDEAEASPAATQPVARRAMLLVEGRDRARMAIPLDEVARLEEYPQGRLERVADRWVVQYRGQILPLFDVDVALERATKGAHPAQVVAMDGMRDGKDAVQVVVSARKRPAGLIVQRIVDIVEQDSDVDGPPSRPGVQRTLVLQGRVTELLDLETLLRAEVEV